MIRLSSIVPALWLAASAFCGIHLGIGGGYGLPAGGGYGLTVDGDRGEIIESSYDSLGVQFGREWKFISYGNGFKFDLDAVYYFNDNFGVMLATGYGFRGGWTCKKHFTGPAVLDNYTRTIKSESGYFPLNLGVKMKADFFNLSPYVYVAPGLYFPSLTLTHTDSRSEAKIETTYDFNIGLGVASGLGIITFTSPKMGIKLELFSNYAYASISEHTDDYSWGGSSVTEYVDKPEGELASSESNALYQYTFSSVGIKLGVVIVF
jgi:hypothetical protein